jgi:hypothetical protein
MSTFQSRDDHTLRHTPTLCFSSSDLTAIAVKVPQGQGQMYLNTDRKEPNRVVSTATSLRAGRFRFQIPVPFKVFSP